MKLDEHLIEIKEDIKEMKVDLKYHIRRTDILEELHKDNAKRIVLLEEPKKARAYIYEAILSLGKIVGVALTILAVLKYFN